MCHTCIYHIMVHRCREQAWSPSLPLALWIQLRKPSFVAQEHPHMVQTGREVLPSCRVIWSCLTFNNTIWVTTALGTSMPCPPNKWLLFFSKRRHKRCVIVWMAWKWRCWFCNWFCFHSGNLSFFFKYPKPSPTLHSMSKFILHPYILHSFAICLWTWQFF